VVSLVVGSACDDEAEDLSIEVAAGEPVALTVAAEVPPDTGGIVGAEWDLEGDGTFADSEAFDGSPSEVELCETHRYEEPGTYFAVVRISAQREGDPAPGRGLVQNLARVRVVVT